MYTVTTRTNGIVANFLEFQDDIMAMTNFLVTLAYRGIEITGGPEEWQQIVENPETITFSRMNRKDKIEIILRRKNDG